MPVYIAFLRAINVGGHVVKMDVLRQEFSALGFADVNTYIQSGNVLFQSAATPAPELEQLIAARLEQTLGYAVATFVRTPEQLIDLAAQQPFGPLPAQAVDYVSFLPAAPPPEQSQALLDLRSDIDSFALYTDHVLWRTHKAIGPTALTNATLEKVLKLPASRRNMNTVNKIIAKYLR